MKRLLLTLAVTMASTLATAQMPFAIPDMVPSAIPEPIPGGGGVGFKWLTEPSDQSVNEGAELAFSVSAKRGGIPIVYSIGANDSGSVNASTGAYSWTPSYAGAGTYTVTFTATAGGRKVTKAITVTVINVSPVEWVHTPVDTTGKQRTAISVTYNAASESTITYSATGLPTGATYNASTGAFAWTPDSTQYGAYPITFIATVYGDTIEQTATFTISKIYNVLSFDGGDYASMSTLTVLNDLGAATIEFWMLDSVATAGRGFFVRYEDVGNHNGIRVEGSSDTSKSVFMTRNEETTNGYTRWITSNYLKKWHHYAFVYNGAAPTNTQRHLLYVDGVEVARYDSFATKATIGNLSGITAYVGRNQVGTAFLVGRMANLRIWNTARSAAQIVATKDSVSLGPGYSANLLVELNYANGTVWYDNSGNGRHFTLAGGANAPAIRPKAIVLPTAGQNEPY